MNPNYLDELNPMQRAAVEYCEGPSQVIAGAGSGKTRVLTYKIAYLLDKGYQPWNILALTFTNKAAREMKERINRQIGLEVRGLYMGTFHSIFYRILREQYEAIGFRPNFTVYDTADSKSLLKSIVKEMNLDEKKYKPTMVQGEISRMKNALILPGQYQQDSQIAIYNERSQVPKMGAIYAAYMERCQLANAMDFDDLLLYTFKLFHEHPDVLARYQEQFQYILVDEYQDTNKVQHAIVALLSKRHQRICVVGDDAQSIYSFRGANVDNILDFQKGYAHAKLFKLEQNYRSTQRIVEAANSLIKSNLRQIPKTVFSKNAEGNKMKVLEAYSDLEEASMVVKYLQRLQRSEESEYQDFAILYRTNAQSRSMEAELRKHAIPYRIYGGLSFYQRKEIKDVIAYLRLTINPHDEEALKRIINVPKRSIGQTSVGKMTACAHYHGVSLWDVISNPEKYELDVAKRTQTRLIEFAELISSLQQLAQEQPADKVVQASIQQTGIMGELLGSDVPEDMSRRENLEELLNAAIDFVESREELGDHQIMMPHYLMEVSLMTDQDSDDKDDPNKVTLMTIHSAKGLEFPFVFVVGLEEDLLPNRMAIDSPRQVEEERRLFYVAITRAERACTLSFAKNRFVHGKSEFHGPSRFLTDIAPEYLDWENDSRRFSPRSAGGLQSPRRVQPTNSQTNLYTGREIQSNPTFQQKKRLTRIHSSASASVSASQQMPGGNNQLKVGDRILHSRFGPGVIQGLEGEGSNAKAVVSFEQVGEKQLLLRFARFEKMG
ncbi:MAG TPA: UvrD-helicase domain-containing protein [Bacteroidaceae bacterium]|nr:UvrD-helicase domain-containing protein [Bacteroidaceae bacterium]